MAARRTNLLLLMPMCLLASCGGSTLSRTIYTNPPDASVYMDGVRVQKGMNLNHEFGFENVDRVLLQATSPGFEPSSQYVTRRTIEALIRNDDKLRIELRQR
ncbi:MAG: hypothetical protein AB8H80_08140 [Planctomycetota bacterium]